MKRMHSHVVVIVVFVLEFVLVILLPVLPQVGTMLLASLT
jgi:hypothetical protein